METLSSLSILCEGNPPVTGWFSSQRAGNTGFGVFFSYTRLNKPSSCRWLRASSHKCIWEQRKQEILGCLWTPCLVYKKTILLFWCAKVATELSYIISYTAEHYNDVIMSTVSLAFVRGIHRWPVNSPHTRPVTRKMSQFDDVIMPALGTCFWHTSHYVVYCTYIIVVLTTLIAFISIFLHRIW